MSQLTNVHVIGVPLMTIVGAALFTWYASQKYQADLSGIESRIALRLEALEKTVSRGTVDRFTRGDFYVWCVRSGMEMNCDNVLTSPAFAVTGPPWVTTIEKRR
jgi:hypothetical protein